MTKRFASGCFGVLCAGLSVFAGCSSESKESLTPVTTCDTANVTYAAVIKPITDQQCATSGCHAAGSNNTSGIDLSGYAGLKAIADDGSLLGTIRRESGYVPMPLGADKLDDCTIAKYAKWVAGGAPNN